MRNDGQPVRLLGHREWWNVSTERPKLSDDCLTMTSADTTLPGFETPEETEKRGSRSMQRVVLPASPKPYYYEDGITLYHGDCLELLPLMPEVEMVLTDPPYNIGLQYGADVDDGRADYAEWCWKWFGICEEKSKVQAVACGFPNVAMWLRHKEQKWIMAWIKPAAMGRSPMGFCNFEPVLVYGKPQTRRGVDVVTAPVVSDGEVEGHPCPKPLKWASGIIQNLTNDGSILDPFAGSGTTLRAAKDLGRQAIGIEVNERYCEMIAKRMSQGVLWR
jgi:site-specific DNA-methyltransferase (adenine-specific)